VGCKGKKIWTTFFQPFYITIYSFQCKITHVFLYVFCFVLCISRKISNILLNISKSSFWDCALVFFLTFMCIKQTVQGLSQILQKRGIKALKICHTVAGKLLLSCVHVPRHVFFFFFILFSDVMICMLTLQTITNRKNKINILSMTDY